MNDNQLKELEAVLKLVTKYSLDAIEFHPDGTLKTVTKKIHLGPKVPSKKDINNPITIGSRVLSDEDVMFAATAAPKMSLSDFDRFAVNPPKETE